MIVKAAKKAESTVDSVQKESRAKKPAAKSDKKVAPKKVSGEKKAGSAAGVKASLKPGIQEEFKKPERYFEAVGRRKTAVARVRLFTKAGDFTVNDKLYGSYFPVPEFQKITEDALQKMKLFGRFRVSAKVSGGGSRSQAEALRHGLSRCLIKFNQDFRKRLKRAGFLKRDPRMKERKKFGLKKARRAPQWQKR